MGEGGACVSSIVLYLCFLLSCSQEEGVVVRSLCSTPYYGALMLHLCALGEVTSLRSDVFVLFPRLYEMELAVL